MKKLLLTTLLVAGVFMSCFAQKPHMVVFYNLENLFDTINDPDKLDEEFLPQGVKKWNSTKYYRKQSNLDKVFFDIALINRQFPAVIGVSEIENRLVLEDLVTQPKMSAGNYRIVHYDSPDRRGVDCAFLYRPDVFKLEGSKAHKFEMPGWENFYTRDLVTMWGTIEGEPFFFLVSHWPSRLGGKEASDPKREAAAAQCRRIADSVRTANPNTKVVIMGDLNDDATDKSITEVLGAKAKINKLAAGDLYNPYIDLLKAGYGTLGYRDSWNLFDNIIISENLATGSTGKLKIVRAEKSKFYGNIFSRPYMMQREGQYRNYPLRTFVGNNFQNGFSDHLPVFIYVGK
ncbi:MAG: endonuclease/exonuclease/phosphatase family protein [Alistipes sp.]|nr:endonuclease/exonuclease/phosphatase family protein [Alistipes sp.]MBQ7951830.1 endonuclease/exonuclease/phosphatase family protein [Alistipes sp.]MBQ9963178.1 endonuclease/exonuclease/phosphatase family protein [Alistipes sp.]